MLHENEHGPRVAATRKGKFEFPFASANHASFENCLTGLMRMLSENVVWICGWSNSINIWSEYRLLSEIIVVIKSLETASTIQNVFTLSQIQVDGLEGTLKFVMKLQL